MTGGRRRSGAEAIRDDLRGRVRHFGHESATGGTFGNASNGWRKRPLFLDKTLEGGTSVERDEDPILFELVDELQSGSAMFLQDFEQETDGVGGDDDLGRHNGDW